MSWAIEYMEQKATIDVAFALAFGFYTYVNRYQQLPEHQVGLAVLTQDCKEITVGLLNV